MSRFLSGPATSRFHSRSASDGETLQTDVMRFMAILGLCLTAIFALVRTLPLDGVEAQGKSEIESDTKFETVHLKKQVRQLQQQLQSARIESMKANQLIKDARRRVRDNGHSQARKETPPVPMPIVDSSPLSRPVPVKDPHNRNPEIDSEQGFSLRFESAYVLETLIQNGMVVFFAMRDRKAWRLLGGKNGPGFVDTAFPHRFHEMSPDTVPDVYLDFFEKVAPMGTESPPVWGVLLPEETETRIQILVNGGTGGILVISEKGDVAQRRDG